MSRLSENGEVVLVTEQLVGDGQNQRQRIILRVTVMTSTLVTPVDLHLSAVSVLELLTCILLCISSA